MTKTIMSPTELRNHIKCRTKDYLDWYRKTHAPSLPDSHTVLHPNWTFVFEQKYRYLNFHPETKDQVEDFLSGKIDRKYDDAASEIAVHDYIGHMASSQAMCWNVVLPMKKHDNLTPLFNALRDCLREEGFGRKFDFGIETAAVLELNVARDLRERGTATSIDLYLRTAQGKVCTIEFKLTEPDFGQCRQPKESHCDGRYGSDKYIGENDGYLCYLSKVGRRYWHLGAQYNLLNPIKVARPDEVDPVQKCPLNVFYQALRNLMVAKKRSSEDPDGDVRGIFVLAADYRNRAFWGPGNHFDRLKNYLERARAGYRPDIFRISIQDIVSRFSGNLAEYKEFFAVKYGYPAT